MSNSLLTATEFRNRLFEILNLTARGGEFVIEKDGRPAAKLIPYTSSVSKADTIDILSRFKAAFSKKTDKRPWSVLETKEWKEKEKEYLKNLS